MNEVIYKCRKCRSVLFTLQSVVGLHGQKVTSANEDYQCLSANSTVWYLRDDHSVEDWIIQQLDQGSWVKDKLYCPKCHARLGSFDFVSGTKCPCGQYVLPAIHVCKSRVDCQMQVDCTSRNADRSNDIKFMRRSLPPPLTTVGCLPMEAWSCDVFGVSDV